MNIVMKDLNAKNVAAVRKANKDLRKVVDVNHDKNYNLFIDTIAKAAKSFGKLHAKAEEKYWYDESLPDLRWHFEIRASTNTVIRVSGEHIVSDYAILQAVYSISIFNDNKDRSSISFKQKPPGGFARSKKQALTYRTTYVNSLPKIIEWLKTTELHASINTWDTVGGKKVGSNVQVKSFRELVGFILNNAVEVNVFVSLGEVEKKDVLKASKKLKLYAPKRNMVIK